MRSDRREPRAAPDRWDRLAPRCRRACSSPGDANCPAGGVKYTIGGVASTATYVCNGSAGDAGPEGPEGLAGATGHTGATGATGLAGATGSIGATGATGLAGAQGLAGANGATGAQGSIGATGAQGNLGATGATGTAGTSVVTTALASGDAHCANGGVKVTSSSGDVYVCNGAQGVSGAAGSSPTITSDSSTCTYGGVKITLGGSSTYVCNGAPGSTGSTGAAGPPGTSITTSAVATGGTGCALGGAKFTDGTSTTYACNGTNGNNGADATSPAGTIVAFGGATPPAGWLLCDGSSLARSSYSALFSAIGTNWGANDANTFRLPDLRGRFLRGTDHATGNDPSAASRTAIADGGSTGDNVGSIEGYAVKLPYNLVVQPNGFSSGGQENNASEFIPYTDDDVGSYPATAQPPEVRPANAGVNWIIKT